MYNNTFKLDLCNYTINENGVFDADGEILVSVPIIPVSKYLSSDGTQFIGICKLYVENKVEVFVPLKNLEDAKNLDTLAKLGVVVLKSTIKPIANFLFKLVLMNFGRLQELTFVDKFGWYGDKFLPYEDENFLLADELSGHPYFSEGAFYEWRKVVVRHRNNIIVRMALAASFASVLIKIVSAENLVMTICGLSEDGKSVLMRLMASIWGDPMKNGSQVRTALNTSYNNEVVNLRLGGLPLFLDETATRTLSDSALATELMRLAEGVEKGRNTKLFGGSWANTVVLTSEFPLISSKSNLGLANRILHLEAGKIFGSDDESKLVIRTVNKNFGHAGKMFIEAVKEIGFEAVCERYEVAIDILEDAFKTAGMTISHKLLRQFALLYLADTIAAEQVFDRNVDDGEAVGKIDVDDLLNFVSNYHAPNPAEEFYQKLRSVVQRELSRKNGRAFHSKKVPEGYYLLTKDALSQNLFDDFKRFAGALKKMSAILQYRDTYWWPKTVDGVRLEALCVKIID